MVRGMIAETKQWKKQATRKAVMTSELTLTMDMSSEQRKGPMPVPIMRLSMPTEGCFSELTSAFLSGSFESAAALPGFSEGEGE